jgi:hypothetical protein
MYSKDTVRGCGISKCHWIRAVNATIVLRMLPSDITRSGKMPSDVTELGTLPSDDVARLAILFS